MDVLSSVPITMGGVKISPSTKLLAISKAASLSSGVKSIKSSSVAPICSKGAGLVGIG